MDYKVFNIEFDGIDKCGKDTMSKQFFSIVPNQYIPKSRGLLSQIAYSNLYNRGNLYIATEGYVANTLFVLLIVDEEDWNIRCDISGEREANRYRTDMEDEVKYKSNSQAFENAYLNLKNQYKQYESHFMIFNTSKETPYNIVKQVVKRLEELNN